MSRPQERMSISMTSEDRDLIESAARADGVSVSAWIVRAAREEARWAVARQVADELAAEASVTDAELAWAASALGVIGWMRHAFVTHNDCMPLIVIRDVPEAVRDEIARKAAAAGQSMQAYLLGELTKLAGRPNMAEITRRAQARAADSGSTVTMEDAVAAVRASRDRQGP